MSFINNPVGITSLVNSSFTEKSIFFLKYHSKANFQVQDKSTSPKYFQCSCRVLLSLVIFHDIQE